VIFYNGEYLISARLDPKLFLERRDWPGLQEMCSDMLASHRSERCLTDIRFIDVAETGRAMLDKRDMSSDSEILCMCQHSRNSQIFASCHRETIKVWSWFGTDRLDSDKMALVVDSVFTPVDRKSIWYGVAFLSEIPEWIASQDGHVLLTLIGLPHRPWLTIQIIVVFRNTHRILFEQNIGVDGSLLEAARSGNMVFQISQSDRIIIVAGKGAAAFYEIRRTTDDAAETQLSLSRINDSKIKDQIMDLSFSSCLCLPPPKNCMSGNKALDWVILGDSEGDLFGFLWSSDESNRVVLSRHHGRYSSSQMKHDRGVPISLLIPSFGASPDCHHRAIKEKGKPYTQFLEGLGYEGDRFFSSGDNGKLLSWSLGKNGWTSQVEDATHELMEDGEPMPCSPEGGRQFSAAHSSRLVPHVLVAMDHKNKKLICMDTLNMSTEYIGTPLEAMSSVGGA